jgi:hypothetical protein
VFSCCIEEVCSNLPDYTLRYKDETLWWKIALFFLFEKKHFGENNTGLDLINALKRRQKMVEGERRVHERD